MSRRNTQIAISLATGLLLTTACESTKRDDSVQPVETDMIRADFGLGSAWYDYNPSTHVLTPRDASWQYSRDGATWSVDIESYYHPDSGTSGYFMLTVDDGEGAPGQLTVSESVKDGYVCVDLDAPAVVSCEDTEARELVLRTDARPVPAAGFSVVNPALYFVRGEGRSVNEVSGTDVIPLASVRDGAFGDDALELLVSAFDPTAETGHVIQLTTDYQVAQWRVAALDPFTIESRCVGVGVDEASTGILSASAAQLIEVEPSGNNLTLVDLCPGDDETDALRANSSVTPETFRSALWPDNKTFDLLVEFGGVTPAIQTGPEAAFEVRLDDWDSTEGSALPAEIWDENF